MVYLSNAIIASLILKCVMHNNKLFCLFRSKKTKEKQDRLIDLSDIFNAIIEELEDAGMEIATKIHNNNKNIELKKERIRQKVALEK